MSCMFAKKHDLIVLTDTVRWRASGGLSADCQNLLG